MEYEYRKDGWPLCPGCGEDELADLSVADWPASTKADPTALLRCYVCRWEGQVPERPSVESFHVRFTKDERGY